MRELYEPTLKRGGFEDSREIRVALDELTEVSRMRSAGHEQANLFRDFHVQAGSSKERQLRAELRQAQGVLARWAIMAAREEFRTVDLARVENAGDWDATAKAEAGVGDLAVSLFMDGQIEGLIERDTPEARLRMTVDPGLLSSRGLVVVRRKRLMLATTPTPIQFVDMRPRRYVEPTLVVPRLEPMSADVSLEVDKVSEFVLDIRRLAVVSPEALEGVRMLTNNGAMAAEITNVDGVAMPTAPTVIEDAIRKRDTMLVPGTTTYYADRKYRNVHKVNGQEGQETELAAV